MADYTVTLTHISEIRAGDTVEIDGVLKTVCGKDIKRGFMGTTLWGDSFRCGRIPVRRVIFNTPARPGRT